MGPRNARIACSFIFLIKAISPLTGALHPPAVCPHRPLPHSCFVWSLAGNHT
jgi:hypothetical protein